MSGQSYERGKKRQPAKLKLPTVTLGKLYGPSEKKKARNCEIQIFYGGPNFFSSICGFPCLKKIQLFHSQYSAYSGEGKKSCFL